MSVATLRAKSKTASKTLLALVFGVFCLSLIAMDEFPQTYNTLWWCNICITLPGSIISFVLAIYYNNQANVLEGPQPNAIDENDCC